MVARHWPRGCPTTVLVPLAKAAGGYAAPGTGAAAPAGQGDQIECLGLHPARAAIRCVE